MGVSGRQAAAEDGVRGFVVPTDSPGFSAKKAATPIPEAISGMKNGVVSFTRPQRTPVKPAVLEKERNSMAHCFAPSIS